MPAVRAVLQQGGAASAARMRHHHENTKPRNHITTKGAQYDSVLVLGDSALVLWGGAWAGPGLDLVSTWFRPGLDLVGRKNRASGGLRQRGSGDTLALHKATPAAPQQGVNPMGVKGSS